MDSILIRLKHTIEEYYDILKDKDVSVLVGIRDIDKTKCEINIHYFDNTNICLVMTIQPFKGIIMFNHDFHEIKNASVVEENIKYFYDHMNQKRKRHRVNKNSLMFTPFDDVYVY